MAILHVSDSEARRLGNSVRATERYLIPPPRNETRRGGGGGAPAASLVVVKIVTINPGNLSVILNNPPTYADSGAEFIAFPDAFAAQEIAGGNTLSDFYIVGRRYWASVFGTQTFVHSRRVGINASITVWNSACQQKTMNFEDGLLQSIT